MDLFLCERFRTIGPNTVTELKNVRILRGKAVGAEFHWKIWVPEWKKALTWKTQKQYENLKEGSTVNLEFTQLYNVPRWKELNLFRLSQE